MNVTDGDDINVLPLEYVLEEAYEMGYVAFEHLPEELTDEELEEFDISGYTDSDHYANHTLPTLRSMAGFEDSGTGTWTVQMPVAAIDSGCEEDEPAMATVMSSQDIFEMLVDEYHEGAHDAVGF